MVTIARDPFKKEFNDIKALDETLPSPRTIMFDSRMKESGWRVVFLV